jgi:CheY-like chemotaxis protein
MHVLYVEDNFLDVLLLKKHLGKYADEITFTNCMDGIDAMQYLGSIKNPADLPGIIITDINMPKMNGHELLGKLKADPLFQKIPVIIFSGSSEEVDIARAYKFHASCYIVKPTNLEVYKGTINALISFWKNNVKLYEPQIQTDLPE